MKAIDFALRSLWTNEIVRLSQFQGQPVMLTFWVSWCPDCMRDLSAKHRFYEMMNKEKLAFLTVNVVGRERDRKAPKSFLEKNGYRFPVLLDEGRKYYDLYECQGVPATILIDENFNIAARYGDKAAFSEIMSGLAKFFA